MTLTQDRLGDELYGIGKLLGQIQERLAMIERGLNPKKPAAVKKCAWCHVGESAAGRNDGPMPTVFNSGVAPNMWLHEECRDYLMELDASQTDPT